MRIREDDVQGEAILSLLQEHLDAARGYEDLGITLVPRSLASGSRSGLREFSQLRFCHPDDLVKQVEFGLLLGDQVGKRRLR